MTAITTDQQRMEAAARSVAVKLEAFHESLTSDEQRALDVALRRVGGRAEESTEDTAGYSVLVGPAFGPLIVAVLVDRLLRDLAGSTHQPSR